jgi:hypothetical protein
MEERFKIGDRVWYTGCDFSGYRPGIVVALAIHKSSKVRIIMYPKDSAHSDIGSGFLTMSQLARNSIRANSKIITALYPDIKFSMQHYRGCDDDCLFATQDSIELQELQIKREIWAI